MNKTTIPTTEAIRRLNSAIAEADRLSDYRFDQCEPSDLVKWLTAGGRLRI